MNYRAFLVWIKSGEDFVAEVIEIAPCRLHVEVSLRGKAKSGGQMRKNWFVKTFGKKWMKRVLIGLGCILGNSIAMFSYFICFWYITVYIVGPFVVVNIFL